MTKEKIAAELYEFANRHGLVSTLYMVFGKNVNVNVPFSRKACNNSIEEIQFSARAANSMKRSGIFTIGDIIDSLQDERLLKVRNLGHKTYCEIQTKILVYGYERLNEREKLAFFRDVVRLNCD